MGRSHPVRVHGLIWIYGQWDQVVRFMAVLMATDVAGGPVDLEHLRAGALVWAPGTMPGYTHVPSPAEDRENETDRGHARQGAGRKPQAPCRTSSLVGDLQ